jgi:hypothetical protein
MHWDYDNKAVTTVSVFIEFAKVLPSASIRFLPTPFLLMSTATRKQTFKRAAGRPFSRFGGLVAGLVLLTGSSAFAQLAGTYTINKNAATGGTNFASFTEAAAALNTLGISASVRFNVLNGPYAEQFTLGQVAGVSATDTIVVDGGASKQTLTHAGTSAQPTAVLLNETDYVTLQNLTIDASASTTYGIGVHLSGQANNNRVTNCVVMGPSAATGITANAALWAGAGVVSGTSVGDANNLRIENNVFSGGYHCVIVTGRNATTRNTGLRVTGNEVRDFYVYGIDIENQSGAQVLGNDVHRSSRAAVGIFYGVYLLNSTGTAVERNRIHDTFNGNTASTSSAYGIYFSADGTGGAENDAVNNLIYNFTGSGMQCGIYNVNSDYARYYHNTIALDNVSGGPAQTTYGFYQGGLATGVDFRNNVVSVTRTGGTGSKYYALYFMTTTSTIASNYNDLYVGTGTGYFTGRYGTTDYATLATWRTANGSIFDQNSVQADPRFVNPTGNLMATATALDGAGTPLARVPRDFAGVLRATPPDLGAYELAPVTDDVALVSIDSPGATALPGLNPVRVTIRNNGMGPLTSVTLTYELNGGTPVAQTFAGLALAVNASQQLTFTTGANVTQTGTNTLAVTASLPNGNADGNPTNNALTLTFGQPAPLNDEPCAAVALGLGVPPITSSNAGASTSTPPGINTPACGGNLPRDVWFSFTAAPFTFLQLTGAPAGTVRIFSSPSCSAGPFTQVLCQGSGTANTSVGNVPLTTAGLISGQTYYVAVSGFGASDTPGPFTIALGVITATRTAASTALSVYPNPGGTGQLTLRLASGTAGTVELLNALGQVVQRQPLAGTAEQAVSTRGLAAGLYTLRVQAGAEVLARKVVLQ